MSKRRRTLRYNLNFAVFSDKVRLYLCKTYLYNNFSEGSFVTFIKHSGVDVVFHLLKDMKQMSIVFFRMFGSNFESFNRGVIVAFFIIC